jgi:diamine N-acetyltransferase
MAAKTDRVFADLPRSKPSADTTGTEADATVSLREISRDTALSILRLKVTPEQEHFVASNAVSIAQAHFEPHAWFRGIYADDTPVGFVMLHDDPAKGGYYLWRLMIAAEHQRKGYGQRAVEQLIEHVRTRPGAREMLVSYVPGASSPCDFYAQLGFEDTGDTEGAEVVMRLPLQSD